MKCHNHPEENAWYYLKLPGPDGLAELKVLMCLGCTEASRDRGLQEQLWEIPYGVEHKARGL